MELRVLRYFVAVAREESITGAAESLHVTQPTLSRQLMELEEELGKKLFIRGSRKLTLTDEGVLLRKRAEEIIELVEKTETEIITSDEIINGDIYIGGGETDAMRIIAQTAKKLQKEYPNIRYHIFSGNADDVTERLDKGLLDFGILIEPADIKKYEYIKLPATDIWGLLMRKDSPLASCDTIKPENLLNIPLLCSRQSMVGKEISEWIGLDYDKLNIVTTYNLVYNASLMVEEGIGYALSLDKLVNTTGNSVLCFKPLEPKLEVGLNIVWKKSQIFSKAAKKFLERLEMEV
ncbi:LysR family transcriptional regulator [uncultured Fusobacterium sp.]|uniref:LysR family transcriptional regulator n=1 Tax=uncultured Fusobacterium sp. TaxID=159267 RepID=UPI000BBABD00|nr:LysR family transcriptional regulator [uncultured Fusobacterium sp.]BBA50234.1 putative transcriptional regulator [Fusobacterium varium]